MVNAVAPLLVGLRWEVCSGCAHARRVWNPTGALMEVGALSEGEDTSDGNQRQERIGAKSEEAGRPRRAFNDASPARTGNQFIWAVMYVSQGKSLIKATKRRGQLRCRRPSSMKIKQHWPGGLLISLLISCNSLIAPASLLGSVPATLERWERARRAFRTDTFWNVYFNLSADDAGSVSSGGRQTSRCRRHQCRAPVSVSAASPPVRSLDFQSVNSL